MNDSFTKRLKSVMDLRHLGPTEIARKGGPSRPTLHRILVEPSYSPEHSTLQRLADALEVHLHWLLTGEGEMGAAPLSITMVPEGGMRAGGSAKVSATIGGVKRDVPSLAHQLAQEEILSETDYLLNEVGGLDPEEVPAFMRAWRKAKLEAARARELSRQAEEEGKK